MLPEYEESPRIVYGGAVFVRVCPKCGRFVSADETVRIYEESPAVREEPNATCGKHGRVQMPFEGFLE